MVYRRVEYACENCRRAFADFEAARSCELGHIADVAVERTIAKIQRAFAPHREDTRIEKEDEDGKQ